MSQLPNPNSSKPYDKVIKDDNDQELWGIRDENTSEEEIVHIPTGMSNHKYYKPEMVLDPSRCKHEFTIVNMGKREVECDHCHLGTSFVVGVNTFEVNGKISILIGGKKYPLKPKPL
jgi:hypothetical protein